MSELHIETRDDIGRITRILASRPECCYTSHAGPGGTIVIDIDDEATERAGIIAWLRSPAGEAWSETRMSRAAEDAGSVVVAQRRAWPAGDKDVNMQGMFTVEDAPGNDLAWESGSFQWRPGEPVL